MAGPAPTLPRLLLLAQQLHLPLRLGELGEAALVPVGVRLAEAQAHLPTEQARPRSPVGL